MTKQKYEFDHDERDAGLTQGELEQKMAEIAAAQGIQGLQVHSFPAPQSNKLLMGFLTYPNNMTQPQLDAIAAGLSSVRGLVGWTPPIPPPPSILSLDATAGVAAAGAIFPSSASFGYVAGEYYDPNTGIDPEAGRLDADGYTDGIDNPDPQIFENFILEFELKAGASGKMEFAASSIVLKDSAGIETALTHPKLTFNVPAQSKHFARMYVLGGQLYRLQEVVAGVTTLPRKSVEQAIALPGNPLTADYVLS